MHNFETKYKKQTNSTINYQLQSILLSLSIGNHMPDVMFQG